MDDSEMAQQALEFALENHPTAEITVLHVVGKPSPWGGSATSLALEKNLEEAAEERSKEVFDAARELAAEHAVEISTEIQLGHPARAILNRADDYDVIVIGSHGGSLVDRLVIGDVAQTVFRRSPVPVIVVR